MSKKNDYLKIDYHYLVIHINGCIVCTNLMGELAFPCVQTAVSDDVRVGLLAFNREGFVKTFLGTVPCKTKVYKSRHCGVRRIMHYIHGINLEVNSSVLIKVPVIQLVTNKPSILSAESKAILRNIEQWKFWKSDVKVHGGVRYSYDVEDDKSG